MHPTAAPIPHQDTLGELIAIGTAIARTIRDQATQAPENVSDTALAFERVARAIRRTILLAGKLELPARADPRIAARKHIIRRIEDVIHRETLEPHDAQGLREELRERLDSPDIDDDVDNRPINEIIHEICADMGLARTRGSLPKPRRTPEDIQRLGNQAARRILDDASAQRRADTAPPPKPGITLDPATPPPRTPPPPNNPANPIATAANLAQP